MVPSLHRIRKDSHDSAEAIEADPQQRTRQDDGRTPPRPDADQADASREERHHARHEEQQVDEQHAGIPLAPHAVVLIEPQVQDDRDHDRHEPTSPGGDDVDTAGTGRVAGGRFHC